MTAFVLVSGTYTGGWIWQEVVDRLRGAGATAHPATLTGMGDRRHLAGPGTDLETHIEDLVQLIDHVDAPELVIVGHCYGIQPVVGAADRRPDRISRIVYLDSPLPENGRALLDQIREEMPDPVVRQKMLDKFAQAEDGWRVPPPTAEEWDLWGSAVGIPEQALARLHQLAAPQPLGSYTRPLRLTGAVAKLPTSGIFCTAGGGANIAMVEAMVASGHPRFQPLADPRAGYFELETGHYPMLSAPEELAEVLLKAAVGEGRRVTAAAPRPVS